MSPAQKARPWRVFPTSSSWRVWSVCGRGRLGLNLTGRRSGDEIDVERYSQEAEKTLGDIWPATRRQYSAEQKVRIVIAGMHGESSLGELCRREDIRDPNKGPLKFNRLARTKREE